MRVFSLDKRLEMQPRIKFTDQDLVGVYLPHKDTLVVTLRVANYDIWCVLIDNGTAVIIIFFLTPRKMEFDLRRIKLAKTKLTGFSVEVKVSEGSYITPHHCGECI